MKRFLFVLVVTLLAISACTLDTAQDVRESSLNATQTAIPQATKIVLTDGPVSVTQGTPDAPPTPVLQPINTETCGKLRVDVGSDPGNTLRLRDQPSNSATIILLIPNNTLVTRVAGSVQVSAGGYTWLNIQYTDPNGVVATGWAAKDAMRDRETLVQAGC